MLAVSSVALGFSPAAAAATGYTYTVDKVPGAPITVGNEPDNLAYDSANNTVWVTNYAGQSVTEIDAATNAVLKTITLNPLSQHTQGIAIDSKLGAKGTVYVAVSDYNEIWVIDAATQTITGKVTVGADPGGIDVDPNNHEVWITNHNDPSVSVLHGVTAPGLPTLVTKITDPGLRNPQSMVLDTVHHIAYATNNGNGAGHSETLINETTKTVIATVQVGLGPFAVGVDPTHGSSGTAYVTNWNAGTVSVIDAATRKVVKTVDVGNSRASQPQAVMVDTTTHTVYIADDGDGTVTVIDGSGTTYPVTATLLVGSGSNSHPEGGTVIEATHTVYVSDDAEQKVSVIVQSPAGSVTSNVVVGRLSGATRYDTAAAISKAEFPNGNAGAVVLARGDDYPDALVAAPLAVARNAPVLLTTGASLPGSTKTELQRVLPSGGTVYVLGGTGAVPASISDEVTSLGYQVVRYGGATRFATAVAVADALGDPTTVLLATGTNFPDALSAGAAAAKVGGVVLLTNGSTMPAETSSYLSAHVATVYAVGGPAAAADTSATPLVGSDRFQTAVDVAGQFYASPTLIGVATGLNFPDALAGGAFLGHSGAPLLLASTSSVPGSVGSYLASYGGSVTTLRLFGGTTTLASAVQNALLVAIGH